MPSIQVSIIRFVDEHQPGFVEAEFADANGNLHTLVDKVPVFSLEDLWSDSVYPQPGAKSWRGPKTPKGVNLVA
jgi:hypothetical protein